jgi:dynein heavy chain, axonemal
LPVLSGVRYGPPGSRRLVYFVDDMNMPFVDKYDTQSAIELLRQMIDYHGWCVRLLSVGQKF